MTDTVQKTSNDRYSSNNYNPWITLPPNIPPPNTPKIDCLRIIFQKLLYLNQINVRNQKINFKVEWWGMPRPHQISQFQSSNKPGILCVIQYVVCCQIEKLMGYLKDMKVLPIQLTVASRPIGRAYLNFLLLKGWKGEQFETSIDIKNHNKKIGQMFVRLEINKVDNPLITNQEGLANIWINQSKNKMHSYNTSAKSLAIHQLKSDKIVQEEFDEIQPPEIRQTNSKTMSRVEQASQSKQTKYMKADRLSPQISHTSLQPKLNTFAETAHRTINLSKYETEKIRLVEDYNLLFQRSISNSKGRLNIVEIEVANIEVHKQEIIECEATLPLLNGSKNTYKFKKEGIIKANIDQQREDKIISYLKQTHLTICCNQKYEGSIPLSKILAQGGELVVCPLYEKTAKKGDKRLKGQCLVKAIIPAEQKQNKISNQQAQKINNQGSKNFNQLDTKQKGSYLLIYIKQYHALDQSKNRRFNYCVQLYSKNQQPTISETKTIWDNSDGAIYDFIICKIRSTIIQVQLFDKQKSNILLGRGKLQINSPISLGTQIPIQYHSHNRQVALGYLQVDYYQNGLENIAKIRDLITKRAMIRQNHIQSIQHKNISQQNAKPQQKSPIIQNNHFEVKNDGQEKEKESQLIQEQQKATKQDRKQHAIEQQFNFTQNSRRQLSLLQICNKIFTFLNKRGDILNMLQQERNMKLGKIEHLFSSVVKQKIISKSQYNIFIQSFLEVEVNQKDVIVSVQKLVQSFEAFQSYYFLIIQEMDQLMGQFIDQINQKGITISEIQNKTKGNLHFWPALKLQFSNQADIGLEIQSFKFYFDNDVEKSSIKNYFFCDSLRKFEVFETMNGFQIPTKSIKDYIYLKIRQLLSVNEFQIVNLRNILKLLNDQQIVLTQWQMLNLNDRLEQEQRQYKPLYTILQHQKTLEKQHQNKHDDKMPKQTITKSPTFGYLHNPDNRNEQIKIVQNNMVDSLAIKMHAISPINKVDDPQQTIKNYLRVVFSNLANRAIKKLTINGCPVICLSSSQFKNYQSYSNLNEDSHDMTQKGDRQQLDLSPPPMEEYRSKEDKSIQKHQRRVSQDKNYLQLSVHNIQKMFSYEVEVIIDHQLISLQATHNDWAALVSNEGQYLGGLLIY